MSKDRTTRPDPEALCERVESWVATYRNHIDGADADMFLELVRLVRDTDTYDDGYMAGFIAGGGTMTIRRKDAAAPAPPDEIAGLVKELRDWERIVRKDGEAFGSYANKVRADLLRRTAAALESERARAEQAEAKLALYERGWDDVVEPVVEKRTAELRAKLAKARHIVECAGMLTCPEHRNERCRCISCDARAALKEIDG